MAAEWPLACTGMLSAVVLCVCWPPCRADAAVHKQQPDFARHDVQPAHRQAGSAG